MAKMVNKRPKTTASLVIRGGLVSSIFKVNDKVYSAFTR
jgi:hypothetical protein